MLAYENKTDIWNQEMTNIHKGCRRSERDVCITWNFTVKTIKPSGLWAGEDKSKRMWSFGGIQCGSLWRTWKLQMRLALESQRPAQMLSRCSPDQVVNWIWGMQINTDLWETSDIWSWGFNAKSTTAQILQSHVIVCSYYFSSLILKAKIQKKITKMELCKV